jgi:hypothetical protein
VSGLAWQLSQTVLLFMLLLLVALQQWRTAGHCHNMAGVGVV